MRSTTEPIDSHACVFGLTVLPEMRMTPAKVGPARSTTTRSEVPGFPGVHTKVILGGPSVFAGSNNQTFRSPKLAAAQAHVSESTQF
jgi:hypothetical protein